MQESVQSLGVVHRGCRKECRVWGGPERMQERAQSLGWSIEDAGKIAESGGGPCMVQTSPWPLVSCLTWVRHFTLSTSVTNCVRLVVPPPGSVNFRVREKACQVSDTINRGCYYEEHGIRQTSL